MSEDMAVSGFACEHIVRTCFQLRSARQWLALSTLDNLKAV